MRRRWTAAVTVPLFAVSLGSCSDSTGPITPSENLLLAFCASETPVWFAIQNEGANWTRVLPNANNAFAFEATPKVAIAMTFDFGTERLTDIYYTTAAELKPLSEIACTETQGTKTVNGSVSGVPAGSRVVVSMSGASDVVTSPTTAFSLFDVADAPQDLIAHREAASLTDVTPNWVIVRRALNPTNNAVLPVLSFGSEGAAVSTHTATISGLQSNEINYFDITFETATGTQHALYASPEFVGSSQIVYGIPGSLTQAGDAHSISLNADANDGSYRTVNHWYRNPGNLSLAFGAALNNPTVTSIGSTPYARLRATLAAQSDYGSFATAYFIQSTRSVFVTVTSNHMGGTVSTWTIDIPDVSSAGGYPSNAGLQTATSTQWFMEAFSGSLAAFIGSTPVEGATIKFAGRSSTTSTVQMSATDRQRPLREALLNRRAFKQ